jgi:hypothetical protein
MRKLLLFFVAAIALTAQTTQPTAIFDNKINNEGVIGWTGSISILSRSVTPSGVTLAPAGATLRVVNGSLSAQLYPGTYQATYVGTPKVSLWTVPLSGPVTVHAIESNITPLPSPSPTIAASQIVGLGLGSIIYGGPTGTVQLAAPSDGVYCTKFTASIPSYYSACGGGGADGNTSVQYNSGGLLAGDSTQFAWFETSIGTPTAPVVTQHGAAGAVTYAYQIAWLTLAGNGPGGAITTTTTGNAVLSGTNYNIITPPACPANASGYIVVRITDPNSNTGVLPVLGTCGAPVNDVYPSLVSAMFNIPLPDQSTGLYSTQITTPVGMFGSSVFPLNSLIGEYFGSGPGYPLISIATTATTVYPTAGQFYADDLTGGAGSLIQGLQSIAVSNGADGTTTGVLFVAAHNGAANNTASLYGGYGSLFNEDSGNVPGWSAIYEGNNVTTSSTGRFADAAAFDVPAGLFSNSTSTGVNAVLHSLQAPTVPISYFLLEEGGIPSKLAGSLTITPLKSTTGQRFVCVDNAGLLHSSTTACVGT